MFAGGATVTPPPGPGLADWLTGLFRGFLPHRWLLGLVGLALTGLSAVVAHSAFGRGPLDWTGWWLQPVEHAQALRDEVLGGSLGRIMVRGGLLLALNAALWCLIGGWIARHELVARRRGRFDIADERVAQGATAFLVGWWKRLLVCCPCVLIIILVLLLPVLLAGWACAWFGGPGALVVALVLPVVLVADLAGLAVALGAAAWPLMPVTIAAECSDEFDALSRSYHYSFQRPIRFLLLTAAALGLAGLPLGVVYALADQTAAWQPEARLTLFVLTAALSASIFWSLQTLVYLDLRAAIDGVDAGEVAVGPPPKESPRAPASEGGTAEVPAAGGGSPHDLGSLVRSAVLWLAASVGSWWLTYWLLTRASGGQAEWLGWGMAEGLVPPGEGIARVASVIAGLWGVAWVVLPLVSAVRRYASGRAPYDIGLLRRTETEPGRTGRST